MKRSSLLQLANTAATLCREESEDPTPDEETYADYLYWTFLLPRVRSAELEAWLVAVRRGDPTAVVGLPVCLVEAIRAAPTDT